VQGMWAWARLQPGLKPPQMPKFSPHFLARARAGLHAGGRKGRRWIHAEREGDTCRTRSDAGARGGHRSLRRKARAGGEPHY
jgi:hypothetical protein